jgi:hypothetical protein
MWIKKLCGTVPNNIFMHIDKYASNKEKIGCVSIFEYGNGVGGGSDIYRYPRQSIEKAHRITMPKEQSKPFYQSSLFCVGQLKNPNMNDSTITQKIPSLTAILNSRKNPLTHAPTTVSLKMSKNALEIASCLCLLNTFIVFSQRFLPYYTVFVKENRTRL